MGQAWPGQQRPPSPQASSSYPDRHCKRGGAYGNLYVFCAFATPQDVTVQSSL
jgi:hypothetical protein